MSAFHELTLDALDGKPLPLDTFKGKVVLVVNVASKCGLTPQYAALENLYQQFKGKGFSVLGVPCNQFAGQEPGSEQDIQAFLPRPAGRSRTLRHPEQQRHQDQYQQHLHRELSECHVRRAVEQEDQRRAEAHHTDRDHRA